MSGVFRVSELLGEEEDAQKRPVFSVADLLGPEEPVVSPAPAGSAFHLGIGRVAAPTLARDFGTTEPAAPVRAAPAVEPVAIPRPTSAFDLGTVARPAPVLAVDRVGADAPPTFTPPAPQATEASAVLTRPPHVSEIRALPEPSAIGEMARAAGSTALTQNPLFSWATGDMARRAGIESPAQRTARLTERAAAQGPDGPIQPEDINADAATKAGQFLSVLIDPTILIPFMGGERLALAGIEAIAKNGVPRLGEAVSGLAARAAREFVWLANNPSTASIARKALASAVQSAATAGTGVVASQTVEKLGREKRLPTPAEAAAGFVSGTVGIPPLAAAGTVGGAALMAIPGVRAATGALSDALSQLWQSAVHPRTLSTSTAVAAPADILDAATAARDFARQNNGGRLPPDQEAMYARRILGIGEDATDADISAALRQRAAQYHPSGRTPDEDLFKVYSEAAGTLRLVTRPAAKSEVGYGAQEPVVSAPAGAPPTPQPTPEPARPATRTPEPVSTTPQPEVVSQAVPGPSAAPVGLTSEAPSVSRVPVPAPVEPTIREAALTPTRAGIVVRPITPEEPAAPAAPISVADLLGGGKPLEQVQAEAEALRQKQMAEAHGDVFPALYRDESIAAPPKDYRGNDVAFFERINEALDRGRVADARALYDEGVKEHGALDTSLEPRLLRAEADVGQQQPLFPEAPGRTAEPQPATSSTGQAESSPAASGPREYVSESHPHREATPEDLHVRDVARGLKDRDPAAIAEAAAEMAPRIPEGAHLWPAPDSEGSDVANATLAEAIAEIRPDVTVQGGVQRYYPVESSRIRRQQGKPGLTADEQFASIDTARTAEAGVPNVIVDNVEVTGATGEGVRRAIEDPNAQLVTYAKAPVPAFEGGTAAPVAATPTAAIAPVGDQTKARKAFGRDDLVPGARVFHPEWGPGTVTGVEADFMKSGPVVHVRFDDGRGTFMRPFEAKNLTVEEDLLHPSSALGPSPTTPVQPPATPVETPAPTVDNRAANVDRFMALYQPALTAIRAVAKQLGFTPTRKNIEAFFNGPVAKVPTAAPGVTVGPTPLNPPLTGSLGNATVAELRQMQASGRGHEATLATHELTRRANAGEPTSEPSTSVETLLGGDLAAELRRIALEQPPQTGRSLESAAKDIEAGNALDAAMTLKRVSAHQGPGETKRGIDAVVKQLTETPPAAQAAPVPEQPAAPPLRVPGPEERIHLSLDERRALQKEVFALNQHTGDEIARMTARELVEAAAAGRQKVTPSVEQALQHDVETFAHDTAFHHGSAKTEAIAKVRARVEHYIEQGVPSDHPALDDLRRVADAAEARPLAEPEAIPQSSAQEEAPHVGPAAEPGAVPEVGEVGQHAPSELGREPARGGAESVAGGVAPAVPAGERGRGEPVPAAPEAGEHAGAGGGVRDTGAGARPRRGDREGDAGRVHGLDYRITDADNLGAGSLRQKAKDNLTAIRLLKRVEAEGRTATVEEQAALAKYVGWGGLPGAFIETHPEFGATARELKDLLTDEEYAAARASTKNAHYTSPVVIRAMYDALHRLGFLGGRVLEPSAGIGHFVGLMPRGMHSESRITAVELDPITGRIAKVLYPRSDVRVEGYETSRLPDNSVDVAVGNIPFGDFKLHDPRYDKLNLLIHDYFFAKTLDKVRPGGIVAFITSKGTLDKLSTTARRYIADRANLLGAIRLPNSAFKANANTEVTADILFLQKRRPGEALSGETFQELAELPNGIVVNEYFARHPEMMLGQMKLEGTQYSGGEPALIAPRGQDLGEALSGAVARLPQEVYRSAQDVEAAGYEKAAEGSREGQILAKPKGQFVMVQDGAEVPFAIPANATERVKALIGIRDATREVLRTQKEDLPDAKIRAAQEALATLYDRFVKQHGPITKEVWSTNDRVSFPNMRYFDEDVDAPLVEALEKGYDPYNGTAAKADLFTKRVIRQSQAPQNVESAPDALLASLDQRGKVDLDYMARLTGRPAAALAEELGGLVWEDPETGQYESADGYLSGNVRQKLVLARAAAAKDPRFEAHVKALEDVQPKDLEPSEIGVNLGAPWVPTTDVQDFIDELLPTRRNWGGSATVRYFPAEAVWRVEAGAAERSPAATDEWGTRRANAVDLIEKALNHQQPKVYDRDGETSVLNEKETVAAQEKQRRIQEKFRSWLFEDTGRADRLLRYYNDNFNNLRMREFDGSHLTFPGANPNITLRPHQKNAVWRYLTNGNELLDHVVGAGKTYVMAAIAMEARRLGLARKPMVQVPNHIVRQFGKEMKALYPNARVLVTEKDDLETAYDRRRFAAKVANNDWDLVIMSHSIADRVSVAPEFEIGFIKERLAEYDDFLHDLVTREGRRENARIIKDIEKAKARLEARLGQLAARERKDTTISFEEMGIDLLMVDEAHLYKNLETPTRMENSPVASKPSQRAFNLLLKTRYLDQLTPGRGLVFATGTPVSNTLSEVHVIQRYLQYRELKERGLLHFDAWAANFIMAAPELELKPEGGFRVTTRFREFINLGELQALYRQVADVQTQQSLGLAVPKIAGGKGFTTIAVEPTPWQLEYQKKLVVRAKAARARGRQKLEKGADNMLAITTDGRMAALDPRMIDPHAPPGNKVPKVAESVYDIWKAGEKDRLTQLVFIDGTSPLAHQTGRQGWSPYDEIRKLLIEKGIPAKEIAFVHDATTDAKKEALFGRVRRGEVRVLMGSTDKMGAGTNVQDRVKAIHHVNLPHRPADIEQRDGRGVRQGNMNDVVDLIQYTTIRTFDANLWQQNRRKATFIDQFRNARVGQRSIEDVDSRALTYAEIMAISTGNPAVMEKAKVDNDLQQLGLLKASHQDRVVRLRREVAQLPQEIKQREAELAATEADARDLVPTRGDAFSVTIDGRTYAKRKDAAPALAAALARLKEAAKDAHDWVDHDIGTFAGLTLRASRAPLVTIGGRESSVLSLVGHGSAYGSDVRDDASPDGVVQSMEALPDRVGKRKDAVEQDLVRLRDDLEQKRKTVEQPWDNQAKYDQLVAREKELAAVLEKLDKPEPGTDATHDQEAAPPDEDATDEGDGDGLADMPESTGGASDKAVSTTGGDGGAFESRAAEVPVSQTTRTLRPISPVELVRLVRDLLGENKIFLRAYPQARGKFYGTQIGLNPSLGTDYQQFAKTLAHEIGHLADYLPEGTLNRGNILGRIASLQGYMKPTIDALPTDPSKALTSTIRQRVRAAAEMAVGKRPAKDSGADLAAWHEKVSREYTQRILDEMEARNLIGKERVNEELRLLSFDFWRPFDPTTATSGHVAYRESSRELYADAVSVLLNSPGTLQARAPTFFDAFLGYLERKPELDRVYGEIQDLIGAGDDALNAARQADLKADFALGEELRKASEERRDKQSLFGHLRQMFLSKATPVVGPERRRVGTKEPPYSAKHEVKLALQEFNHADNANRLLMMDVVQDVQKPLEVAGITQDQAGTYLMLTRIAEGDRGGMAEAAKAAIIDITGEADWDAAKKAYTALGTETGGKPDEEDSDFDPDLLALADKGILNPRGYTPEEAKRTLVGLEKDMGPEKYTQLESLMGRLREILAEPVDNAAALGVYSQQAYNETVLPNRGTYVPFAVLDYFNGRMPAGMRQQVGTVKGIANPYTTAILKAMALTRLNEYQKAKLAVLKSVLLDFPDDVGEERQIDQYHREGHPGAGRANLIYHVDGKLHYREVDQYIANVLGQSDLGTAQRLTRVFSSATYTFFHPLYVSWSLAWQARNLPRDFKRTYKNLSAAHAGKPTYRQALYAVTDIPKLLAAYAGTAGSATRHARLRDDALIRQMLRDRALGKAFHSFDPFEGSTTIERLAQRYGLTKPPAEEPAPGPEPKVSGVWPNVKRVGRIAGHAIGESPVGRVAKKVLGTAGHSVEVVGVMQETWTKAAAYKLLGQLGVTGNERAYITRNYVGTPDSSDRGLASDAVNALYLYSNVILAGWRADMEVGTHPTTASGYWFRSALMDFLPKIIMGAAALGWLGKKYEEWMRYVPSYDQEKYIIIPLPPFYSTNDKGEKKAVYLRIPHDDTNRVLAAITWAFLMEGRPYAPSRAIGVTAGEFPGINPAIELASQWMQFMGNRNPYDAFRSRPVVPTTEWAAGGWPRTREMAQYSLGQFGVASGVLDWLGSLAGYGYQQDPRSKTTAEQVVSHIPAVSALVRVSSRGLTEERWWEIDWETQHRAQLRADLSSDVRQAVSVRARLNRLGEDRLSEDERTERDHLNGWYRLYYLPITRDMELSRGVENDTTANAAAKQAAKGAYRDAIGRLTESLKEPASGGSRSTSPFLRPGGGAGSRPPWLRSH